MLLSAVIFNLFLFLIHVIVPSTDVCEDRRIASPLLGPLEYTHTHITSPLILMPVPRGRKKHVRENVYGTWARPDSAPSVLSFSFSAAL